MHIRSSLIILLICYLSIPPSLDGQDIIDVTRYNQNVLLNQEGWDLLNKEEFQKAHQKFKQAIALNPGNADSYVGAATALMSLGDYDSAKQKVDAVLLLTSNQADIYYLAGNIAFKSANYSEAIVSYTVAINTNDKSDLKIDLANCYFNRANAYQMLKQYASAINDYNRSIELRSDFPDSYHNRGVCHKQLNNEEMACRDFHAADHFGSELSNQYLTDYCNSTKFSTISYQSIQRSNSSQFKPAVNLDTSMVDTLYFNDEWQLTSQGQAKYYRIGTIDLRGLIFQNQFTDHYISGQILQTGIYDNRGIKNGHFERFYESGKTYSRGAYVDNQLSGTWEYYYPNGQLSEIIEFTNEGFYVVSSWDETGKKGVEDGSGKWKKTLSASKDSRSMLIGYFEGKKQVKKWMIRDDKGYVIHIEQYKQGQLVSAEKNGGFMDLMFPTPQLFNKSYFESKSLLSIEKLEPSSQLDPQDYPYIQVTRSTNQKPTYKGGLSAFYRFVGSNLHYPATARKKGTTGDVIVKITVNPDGSLSDIESLSNIGDGLEEEAIRIIKMTNEWIPAKAEGVPVTQSLTLPISFGLAK